MQTNKFLRLSFTLMVLAGLNNCRQKTTIVNFANVCQSENQSEIQLKGFLHTSKTTPNLTSNSTLLVENKNGTGGFIKLVGENREFEKVGGEVKIIGKVLKDNNLCVLQVEKIEGK